MLGEVCWTHPALPTGRAISAVNWVDSVTTILGIWGTALETSKPAGSDIRRRKKSLPLLLALRKRRMASAQLYKLHSLGADLSADQERDVVTLLNRCDAAAGAEHRAEAQRRPHRETPAGRTQALRSQPPSAAHPGHPLVVGRERATCPALAPPR